MDPNVSVSELFYLLIFPIYLSTKLKNFLVRNLKTDFNIIWQKCSFEDPLPRLFKP